MRITIGSKISLVAGILLALMIAISAISIWKVQRVSTEVDFVAEIFVPVAARVAQIDIHVLEQELLFERLLRRLSGERDDGDGFVEALEGFKAGNALVDEEVAGAMELVQRGIGMARQAEYRFELAGLAPRLETIERQHQDFHDLALRIVELRQSAEHRAAEELVTVLQREEQDFDDAIAAMIADLRVLVDRSTGKAREEERQVLRFNGIVTAIAVVLGILFSVLLTRSLVRPVHRLVAGLRRVEEGELHPIPVRSRDEIGDLSSSFNHMVGELRLKERIKDTFGRYLDPRVVEGLIGGEGGRMLAADEGEKRRMTVFFSDIAGFTSFSEHLTPTALVRVINAYFTLATDAIVERLGVIDKYIGDAVMAFWGPPFVSAEDQGRLACLAALDQGPRLAEFKRQLPDLLGIRKDVPPFSIRIGLATGDVLVGNIGSDRQKGYTVMGDTVNLGSRLEGANKVYGTMILVDDRTRRLAGDAVESREIDAITVVGKTEPVQIFELLAPGGGLTVTEERARERYAEALQAYRERRWETAEAAFRAVLELVEADSPAEVFLARIDTLRRNPPGEDWDGVWQLHSK